MLVRLRATLLRLFPTWSHLCLLGFAAPQIWMYLLVSTTQSQGAWGSVPFHGACGVSLIVAAALFHARPDRHIPAALDVCASLAMVVYPLFRLVLPWAVGLSPIALALGGMGCAWCFLRWMGICCAFGRHDAILYLLLSFALAAACRLVAALFPEDAVNALLLVMSISLVPQVRTASRLSAAASGVNGTNEGGDGDGDPTVWVCADAEEQPAVKDEPVESRSKKHRLLVLLEISLYSLVLVVMGSATAEHESQLVATLLNNVLRIALALSLFVWVEMRTSSRDVLGGAQVVFAAMVLIVLGAALIGGLQGEVMISLVSFARFVVLMLMALAAADISVSEGIHPFVVYGSARAAYDLSICIWTLVVGRVLDGIGGVAISLNVLFFGVSCLLFVLMNRGIRTFGQMADEPGGWSEPSALPSDTQAVVRAEVARNAGLTERETQVFLLLCDGRGKAHIAQALDIAENTVRHHCKSVYTKLGVHTREELIDLVEASSPQKTGNPSM